MASNSIDEEAIENSGVVIGDNDHVELIQDEVREPVGPKWYSAFLPKRPRPLSLLTPDENPEGTLSTLNGVIVPVILSMFSSLLFLRVGYIVGNAGLIYALLQLVLAYIILVCTICSISAIATNGSVKGGGVYFMISRTLGPQLGGSVGILFYSANVVSGALYAAGFSESLVDNLGPNGRVMKDAIPDGKWINFGYSTGVLVFCLSISLIGAKAFSRATMLFAVLLLTSLVTLGGSFLQDAHLVGHFNETVSANCTANCSYVVYNTSYYGLSYEHGKHIFPMMKANLYPGFSRDCEVRAAPVSFFSVFGVMFAGVTGIMAGANVSGDLKNPSTSIPRGTLAATATTFLTYASIFICTAMTTDRAYLYHDCLYMMAIDISGGYVIFAGALLVTSCACLNCLIGAARVVEALVSDTMFGRFAESLFGQFKIGTNPVLAVFLTFGLMLLCLLIGSLNKIAQLASVLFLLSYMTINMSCLFLEWASAPNFRPKFKSYSIATCLIGVIGCLGTMCVISLMYSVICMLVCLFFIVLFNFTSQPRHAEWGSIGQALIFHQVRKYLLLMDTRKDHVKFWRPQMLLLIANPRYNCALIDFINCLKKSGLYILGHVHVGDFEQLPGQDPSIAEMPHWLELIDHLKVKAFPEITVAKSMREGTRQLARISGLGAMKPNTIILGFGQKREHKTNYFADKDGKFHNEHLDEVFGECDSKEEEVNAGNESKKHIELMRTVADVIKLEKNVCVARNFHSLVRDDKEFIDIWLIEFFEKPSFIITDPASSFSMQLGTILNMTQNWKKFQLRVFIRIMDNEDRSATVRELERILREMRIPANVITVNFSRIYGIVEGSGAILEESAKLDLKRIPVEYVQEINDLIKGYSAFTAVTFLKLPKPSAEDDEYLLALYNLLQLQSENLPPCLYVYGLKTVVSSSL